LREWQEGDVFYNHHRHRFYCKEVIEVQTENLCYCQNGLVSICTAGSVEEQKKCLFYKKASYSDKCRYFVFDKYCDCLEAQTSLRMQKPPDIL
jgi:hypothetical protein